MSKLILLFISFFNVLKLSIMDNDEANNDFILITKEVSKDTHLLYEEGKVSLSGDNYNYKFRVNDIVYAYQVKDAKAILLNDVAYIFYLDSNILQYDMYDKTGKLLSKENIITTYQISSYGLVEGNQDILIFYNISDGTYNDCYIYRVSNGEKKCFSSGHHEEIIDLKLYENSFFMLAKKDGITDGLFGNGGLDKGIVIAKLDLKLKIVSYITLDHDNNDEALSIDIVNDIIILTKSKSIHLFNTNFKAINNKYVGNNLLIITGETGLIYAFLPDKVTILNGISLNEIASIEYGFTSALAKVEADYILLDNAGQIYQADIIDLRTMLDFKYITSDNSYAYENSLKSLKSIFGNVNLIKKEYQDFYKQGTFGLYDVSIKYQTKAGIEFSIDKQENIPLETNIRNNMIYPSGYRILFNGEGEIDGNIMLSNYQLKDDGIHEVTIRGNNQIKRYTIYVDHNEKQLNNTTSLVINDYKEIKRGEKIQITYSLNKNLNIKYLDTIGLNFESYEVKDNTLVITFNSINTEGFYFIHLNYFDYIEEVGDIEFTNRYYLNSEYWYHVSSNLPVVTNDCFLDDLSYSFDLIDENNTARYLEFEFVNANTNYIYNIPLGNNEIVFNNLPDGDYELLVSLVYDLNKPTLSKKLLYKYMVRTNNETNYGEVKYLEEDSRYSKVRIEIDEKFLKSCVNEISYNQEVLYTHKDVSKNTIIMYSIIALISSFLIGFGVRYIIIKIKNGNNLIS